MYFSIWTRNSPSTSPPTFLFSIMHSLSALSKGKILMSCLLLAQICASAASKCRCFPGDACWPTQHDWDSLKNSVGGRLLATVPLGSPCHDPHYDAALCKAIQVNWTLPQEQ